VFSGIVQAMGEVVAAGDGRLVVSVPAELGARLAVGDSLAVNGCCLTVVAREPAEPGRLGVRADISAETASRTTLDELSPGTAVNLEPALRLGDPVGGHLVQGHVDGVGVVVAPPPDLVVRLPESLVAFVVEKGSIALDGVSLTVVACENDCVRVALIPHTLKVTTLGGLSPGTRVNVEADLVAKLVVQSAATVRRAQSGEEPVPTWVSRVRSSTSAPGEPLPSASGPESGVLLAGPFGEVGR
jgi:riboflavin synthase